jgi:hypothetical protein
MSVYKCINAVQAALAQDGISKDRKNVQQGYSFRGIDDVYNALSPLLAKNGLCILPRMLSRSCEERLTQKGSTLFYVTVEAEFDFVCAEDGSKHTVKTFGEAMDSGDKATNKAMSAAYKYAAFQSFAIPTEGDNDPDATTHNIAPKKIIHTPTAGAMDAIHPEERLYLQELAMEVIAAVAEGKPRVAWERIENDKLESDQKIALWTLLDSKTRSAIKVASTTPL